MNAKSLTAPSSVLIFFTASLWYRFRDKAWRRTVQAGLMPVTAGLVMAGAIVLAQATAINWKTAAVTAVATVLFLASRLHPLLVLAAAAALGACGLLG